MRKINVNLWGIAVLVFVSLNCVNTKGKNTTMRDISEEKIYLDLGKNIAASTQAILGNNLMNAMAKGGPEYALEFCNSKAIPLTDSMAIVHKTAIKRVSDKARNSLNKANKLEKSIIVAIKEQLKNGETPKPEIREVKGKMVTYYPIVTNAMCLQCHGKVNETVQQKTFEKINDFYPNDKATGYTVNQLRGLWVVEMQKTK
jgi:nitrate reductase cytochrome c-type subunit